VFGECVFGDDLGLRPRDQHPSVEVQVEQPERPTPDDVLQRFTGEPAFDHAVVGNHLAGGDQFVEHRRELRRLHTTGLLDDAPRVDARVRADCGQPGRRLVEQRRPRDRAVEVHSSSS
jgi:hypothetical protein